MDLDITPRRKPFPNLSLMKLSNYHKMKGDEVCLNFPLQRPDITYASCVFTWNQNRKLTVPTGGVLGGSGFSLEATLPPDVEHTRPDYTLYPGIDFSLGFTSRGCIRRCPWCIVPKKEGGIKPVARLYEFWDRRHRNIRLLDNNLLAAPNWRQTMEDLIAEGLEVDFNQGLDIRLLNDENIKYLKRVKAKELRFSFDDISYEKAVREGIKLLLASGLNSRKLSFYFLYGFPIVEQECIERAKILASLKVDVYPMAYIGPDGKEPQRKVLRGVDKIPMMHGARQNIDKFLRMIGRLPE